MTDDVIRWHLSGEDAQREPFVAGVYPLLLDETCFFLAVDFDKANGQDDAAAFLAVCQRLELPAALVPSELTLTDQSVKYLRVKSLYSRQISLLTRAS